MIERCNIYGMLMYSELPVLNLLRRDESYDSIQTLKEFMKLEFDTNEGHAYQCILVVTRNGTTKCFNRF